MKFVRQIPHDLVKKYLPPSAQGMRKIRVFQLDRRADFHPSFQQGLPLVV
jgi:hypothetical protein